MSRRSAGVLLRIAAVGQGLLAILAVISLRMPALVLWRSMEVAQDPSIVTKQSDLAPAFVSGSLLVAGIVFGLIVLALAALAGTLCYLIVQSRRYRLCRALCLIECLCIPIGTVPGVLTLLLFELPGVAEAFEDSD